MNRLLASIMPTATALIVAGIAHWHYEKPFWPVFFIMLLVVTALGLISGFIMMIEDEMPGGFNNPDGTEPTPWARRARRIVWATLGLFTLLTGIAIWASKSGYW